MAITHSAYTFNAKKFHDVLRDRIVQNGALSATALYKTAESTMARAGQSTQHFLTNVRFDKDWLNTSDLEVSKTIYWYIIALADTCTPAPSLSSHFPVGFRVVQTTLPLAAWETSAIETVIRGQPLHTLVDSSNNPLFMNEFVGVDQFGGWIPRDKAKELLSKLQAAEQFFTGNAPASLEAVSEIARLWAQAPRDVMRIAYSDAVAMLRSAKDADSDLFVILD
jgi:hypothetical protein